MKNDAKKNFVEWLASDFVGSAIETAKEEYGFVYLTILENWDEEGNPLQELNIELSLGEVLTFSFAPEDMPDTMDMTLKKDLAQIVKSTHKLEVLTNGHDWDALMESEDPKAAIKYMRDNGCSVEAAVKHADKGVL